MNSLFCPALPYFTLAYLGSLCFDLMNNRVTHRHYGPSLYVYTSLVSHYKFVRSYFLHPSGVFDSSSLVLYNYDYTESIYLLYERWRGPTVVRPDCAMWSVVAYSWRTKEYTANGLFEKCVPFFIAVFGCAQTISALKLKLLNAFATQFQTLLDASFFLHQ